MSNRKKRDDSKSRGTQMRRDRERAEARRSRIVTGSIVAAIVVIVVIAGVAVAFSNRGDGETPAEMTDDYGIVYSADAIGSDEEVEGVTPVEIVVYEDFICPSCNAFEQQVASYFETQVPLGVITVEYRPIALLDHASTTDYSSRAANAAACVFDSEGTEAFHEFHDLLFENQPPEGGSGLDDTALTALAEQAGVDDVESCIENRDFGDWVVDANDAASQANIVSTPSVFVGGEEVTGADDTVPGLQDIVNAVLAAGAGRPLPQEPSDSPSPSKDKSPGKNESPSKN